jgi:hypothetical protein
VRHAQGRARRAGVALAAVLTWAGLLAGATGCTSDGSGGGGIDELFGKPPSPEDVIRISPDDAGKGVKPDRRLQVRVSSGRLESVQVVKEQDAQDTPVPGRISDDGLRWEPEDPKLALAARYTVDAVALDGHGRRSARSSDTSPPITAPPSAPG